VAEAVAALAESDSSGKVLAGGQSLVPLLSMRLARPSVLVDINKIPGLDHIRRDGDMLVIGALARQETVLRSPLVHELAPLLPAALRHVGHQAIRNRGTVAGSIAHADPAAELPAVSRALDAQFVVRGPGGTRTVAAADFFHGYLTTALEPEEILIEVRLPVQPPGTQIAVQELARRSGDFAIVAVFTALRLDDDVITAARLAVAGTNPEPLRASAAEAVLVGNTITGALIAEAAAAVSAATAPADDIHAEAAYRRRMAGLLTRRALATAAGTITKGTAA
jgi:carbon-monoxide dehydrogenase medium subunit